MKLSILLYNSFKLTMTDLAIKNYSSRPYRTSYLLGLADCLCDRAVKETTLAKQEVSKYNALVVLKEKEIDNYVNEKVGKLTSGKIISKIFKEPYDKGYKDGSKIDLQNKVKIEGE